MTIEQRLEQLEPQNQRIERKNKRLTVALTLMAVAICAVVTMAATEWESRRFHTVSALDHARPPCPAPADSAVEAA